MALIAKIDPPISFLENGQAEVHARPYEKPTIRVGDEIFIWTSEIAGGHGLAASGIVVRSRVDVFANKTGTGEHKELVLDVTLKNQRPARSLSLNQIAPERDGSRSTPQGALSRVLYKHALNKIVAIDSEVSAFVRSHFEEN